VEITPTTLYILTGLFLVVSFVYSSVGLGGGSSYTALMALFGVSTLAIPMTTLLLNLVVTSVGSYNFIRNRHVRFRLLAPFLAASIPMSYVGGSLHIPRQVFYWMLLASLLFVAVRIYIWRNTAFSLRIGRAGKIAVSLAAGSILGLISGIVGIGGGIYLVPLIIILGLGTEKQAAACGAIFIWLNSLSGLVARLQYNAIELLELIPLLVAVLVGGTLGSFLGSVKYSARTMQRILGSVVLVAIVFLIRKVLSF